MLIVSINTIINAKYIMQNEFCIANLNIDRTKPKIEIINTSNTNKGYEKYANKNHIIKVNIKITDKNLKNVYCDKEHVKIKINNNYVNIQNIKFTKTKDTNEEKIYEIELKNIVENGKLKIDILEGTAIDAGDLKNEKVEYDTNITIDNIAPNGSFIEQGISGGKVNAIINLSEYIRNLEGWKVSENKLKIEKEFTNNISYKLPIVDYAGNESTININITKATFINIIYASHNSNIGWTFGYGNYDIAGAQAVKTNSILKTEALAFNVEGNIANDFVQANSYIYTYWGDGGKARCRTSNMIYNHGYNPSNNTYKSMKSSDLVTIQNKKYFQFGGAGINAVGQTDINGRNPIPDTKEYFKYGICGIKMQLKDYSQFSIVYQILVDGSGWIKACSDGQECINSKQKPMSAFRIALVPKSEKQYVLNTWNTDVGTYKVTR